MTTTTVNNQTTFERAESILARVGGPLARYGLALVIGWIGILKFTAYEAQGIQPLVANSPFMGWLYDVFSVTTFSSLLGVVEVATALLLVLAPWFPRLSAVGSGMAIGLFVATISFLFTTPGITEAGYGFPFLGMTGQFLIKDAALLGIAVWTLGDALRTWRVRNA